MTMQIKWADSALLAIGLQDNLFNAMQESRQLLHNSLWVLRLAKYLNVPAIIVNDAMGGPTTPTLQTYFPDQHTIIHLKQPLCWQNLDCQQGLQRLQRQQWVMIGPDLSRHILPNAKTLLAQGYAVHVLAETTGAKTHREKQTGLAAVRQLGAEVICGETLLFEWSRHLTAPHFNQLRLSFLRDTA